VFSYFISIVVILGPPTKLAQTPLPLEDTIHFGGVQTTIILFSDFPEFVCVGQDCKLANTRCNNLGIDTIDEENIIHT
jgi:hypothetical protein